MIPVLQAVTTQHLIFTSYCKGSLKTGLLMICKKAITFGNCVSATLPISTGEPKSFVSQTADPTDQHFTTSSADRNSLHINEILWGISLKGKTTLYGKNISKPIAQRQLTALKNNVS